MVRRWDRIGEDDSSYFLAARLLSWLSASNEAVSEGGHGKWTKMNKPRRLLPLPVFSFALLR
jgi:hypothetical protein